MKPSPPQTRFLCLKKSCNTSAVICAMKTLAVIFIFRNTKAIILQSHKTSILESLKLMFMKQKL